MKRAIQLLIKYGIPVAISVGLAYFLCTGVNWNALVESLRQDVNYWWFVPVIVISIMSHVFRALRWRLQLRAIGINPPVSALVNSIFGTYFVNLLFPRLGEVWRTAYIANREKASFARVLGSMVGDRLTDTVTVLCITILTFFLAQGAIMQFISQRSGESEASLLGAWWFWALVALAVACVLLLVWLCRTSSQAKAVVKLKGMVANLWEGLASIAKMKDKWWFLLFTVLIWGCYYMQLYVASFAFSFTRDLGFVPVLVLFTLSSIGMAVPSNGGLGPWQFAIIFGLSIYGIGTVHSGVPLDPRASAFAWLVWGVQTMLLIVLGIYAFTSIAIDRRRLQAAGKQ